MSYHSKTISIIGSFGSSRRSVRCNPVCHQIYQPIDLYQNGSESSLYDSDDDLRFDSTHTTKYVQFKSFNLVYFQTKINSSYMHVNKSGQVKFSNGLLNKKQFLFEMAVFSCTLINKVTQASQERDIYAFYHPYTDTYLSWKDNNTFVGIKRNETAISYKPSTCPQQIFPADKDQNIFFVYTGVLDNQYCAVECIFANIQTTDGLVWQYLRKEKGSELYALAVPGFDSTDYQKKNKLDTKRNSNALFRIFKNNYILLLYYTAHLR